MSTTGEYLHLVEEPAKAAAFDKVVRPGRNETRLIDDLQVLRRQQPDHIPTVQRLAELYKRHDSRGLAREAYEQMVELARDLLKQAGATTLPADANRVNHAVHAALYDLADCYGLNAGHGETERDRAERGKAADALLMMIRLDGRDPFDAYKQVGSELLRAERRREALAWISRHERRYPPYRYERALDAFRQGTWPEATKALRRAMLANGYVAEELWTGRKPPRLPWAERPGADIETAATYLERYGARWTANPDALAWVRWYWEHPRTLRARGEYAALREMWSRGDPGTRDQAAWDMDRCIGRQTLNEARANVGTDSENPPWRPRENEG